MFRIAIVALVALLAAVGVAGVVAGFRDYNRTKPLDLVDELARILSPSWSDLMGRARAEGPVAGYDNVISRADAAAQIPEDVSDVLLKNLENESFALEAFTRIPVAQSQTRLPILSALPVAYWVNGDTGLKQTTEVNWANKYLNIEELAAIVPIPENVLDDASFDVWGSVRPLLEQAIAREFDKATVFGVGAPASFPTAIVPAAVAAGNVVNQGTNAAGAGGIVADFSDVYGKVEDDGYDPDTLIARRTLKGLLRKAKSVSGENFDELFHSELREAATYPMRGMWGTGAAGSAQAVAAQGDQFVAGIRRDFTYKVLDQAVIQDDTGAIVYNLAQQDMVALRVTFRAGWQVANTINYDQPTEGSRYPAGVLRIAP